MTDEIFRPSGPSFKLSLGQRGEMLAWGYLARQGFKILEKNYRTRFGEIDIVAEKNKQLYFVEVKTRSSIDKGLPEESVTPEKQKQIARLAAGYLQKTGQLECSAVFGVVAILWQPPAAPEVRWHENAFALGDGYFA